jgi:hypothetical protein
MLYRRRTPRALRAARLGALFVSCLPCAVVGYTWYGTVQAAAALAAKTGGPVSFHVGAGIWLVLASAAVLIWGSARMGTRSGPRVR